MKNCEQRQLVHGSLLLPVTWRGLRPSPGGSPLFTWQLLMPPSYPAHRLCSLMDPLYQLLLLHIFRGKRLTLASFMTAVGSEAVGSERGNWSVWGGASLLDSYFASPRAVIFLLTAIGNNSSKVTSVNQLTTNNTMRHRILTFS